MKTRIRLAGGLAMFLSPLIQGRATAQDEALPSDFPPPVRAGLEDIVSGRTESDETNSDDDTRTLSCSVENEAGSVEFWLAPAPSGACRWTIRRGELELETGFLDKSNAWRAICDGLTPGLYSLEVTGQDGDNLRRRIDFLIGPGNAETAKKGRDALNLHAAKDYSGLIKALEKIDLQAASVPPQMRENLAWARIDGLFFFRKFEDIFAVIDTFRNEHPSSARLGVVAEYEMAALFERGLKMTLEAVRFKNERSNGRMEAGRNNFDRFLSLAAKQPSGQYTALPKRSLRQDIWRARVIRGEEKMAMEEIAAADAARREEFHLLCALLCPEIHIDRADENLQRMNDFIKSYPASPQRPRVELDMGSVALREGERLTQKGDPSAAARYFDLARERFRSVVADKEGVITAADVEESWEGMLRTYHWQRDDTNLMDWTERMISMTKPGDKRWRQAKLFQATVLDRQNKLSEAGAVLDELVAYGFTGHPSHDGRTAAAVKWRIHVARRTGDEEKIRQLHLWVGASKCANSIKRDFVTFLP